MKKLLPLLIFCLTHSWLYAQQKYLMPSELFPDVTSMVDYINQHTVENSDLIFEIKGGERFECAPVVLTARGQQDAQIIIRWDGTGSKPVLNFSGSDLDMESGIVLSGARYITFDGLSITNDDGKLEYAVFITNSSDSTGSQHNTIRNTKITLNKNNSMQTVGINIFPSVPAVVASGSNSYNSFANNHIVNCLIGYHFDSNTGNVQLMNTENNILTEDGKEHVIEEIVLAGVYLLNQNGATIDGLKIHNLHRPDDGSPTAPAAISTAGIAPSGPLTQPFIISNNSIKNHHSESTSIFGMYLNQRNVHYDVFNNTLDNVYTTAAAGNYASGIFVFGTDITANIYNNDLKGISAAAGSLSSAASARGIDVRSFSWVRIYHNTVLLNYESTNADNKSGALNIHNASSQVDIRNNIFINLTTMPDGGTGFASAIFKSSTKVANISDTSDNNIYYAGTPSEKNLIFYGHASLAARDQTLFDYQQRAWTFDQNSFSENVPFLENHFPQLDLTKRSLVRGNAQPITTPIIIEHDSHGNKRDEQYPDMGAIELAEPIFANAFEPAPADSQNEIPLNLSALQWSYIADPQVVEPQGFKILVSMNDLPLEYLGWVDFNADTTHYAFPLSHDLVTFKYAHSYNWQVVPSYDSVKGPDGRDSNTWTFETHGFYHPAKALNPSPENLSSDITVNLTSLTWQYIHVENYLEPTGFHVYAGKQTELEEIGWVEYIQGITDYALNLESLPLDFGATYYWKIVPTADAQMGPVNPDAELWSFETLDNVSTGNLTQPAVFFYPNPASATIHINCLQPQVVQIYDASGRKVLDQHCLQGEQMINISLLKPGIYQIRFMDQGNLQTRKLVIR